MPSDESTLSPVTEERLLRAGFGDDQSDVDFLLAALEDANDRCRVLAVRAATRRLLMDRARWSNALRDASAHVRRETLAQLAYVPDAHDVLDDIRAALLDEDPLVVDAAVFALGEHRDLASLDAIEAVARGHADARCRESAVAALGVLGDPRGLEAILSALDDTAPVRRRAIVALSNFEGPRVDEALEKAKSDRDWQVRAAVDQLTKDEAN